MKANLSVGVLGLGVGKHHVAALAHHHAVSEVYIYDPDKTLMKQVSDEHSNLVPCNSEEQILENSAIDMVSICSYDDLHFKQLHGAISAGQHVFVEKPVCLKRSELKEIYSLLLQSPIIKLSSNLVLRTTPRFKKIKEELRSGNLGQLYFIDADYYWGRREKFQGWRADMKMYSIILGAAIHMIDLVVWLVGELPIEVRALGNNIVTKNTNFRFNSFSVILLSFPSGLIAKITANGGCIYPHFHGLKVFGTKGTAVNELNDAHLVNEENGENCMQVLNESYPAKDCRADVILSFIDSILGLKNPPLVETRDVFDVMSICFSAEDAVNSRKTVDINYLSQ